MQVGRVCVHTQQQQQRACVCECVLCSVCMSEWCMGFETRTSKQSFAFDGSEQTDDSDDDALSASNFSTPGCTENNSQYVWKISLEHKEKKERANNIAII